MSYQQLVTPNINIPYVGGWCEGHVEGTVGQATLPTLSNPTTAGVYRSASQAWSNIPGKHTDLPPKGLRVAAYFSLGSTADGHTAIVLEDGRVATSALPGYNKSSYIYPSLQAMIDDYAKNNRGCTYLGWTEYIGKLRIIGVNMFNEGDRSNVNQSLYGTDKGRFKGVVGKEWKDAMYGIFNSDEYKEDALLNSGDVGNVNATFERNDAKEYQGRTWKDLYYGYVVPNLPAGEYVKVSDLYIKKG